MTDRTRLELNFWLHDSTVLVNRLCDIENSESLRDSDEEGVICNISTRAYTSAVTEDEVSWIRLTFVGWCFEKAFRSEDHWVGVDFRVVGEKPVVSQKDGTLRNAVSAASVLFRAAMRKTHRQDKVPAMRLFHQSVDVRKALPVFTAGKSVSTNDAI